MSCKLDHDRFCFVCGECIFAEEGVEVSSDKFVKSYKDKFGTDPRDRDIDWSPGYCCLTCNRRLTDVKRPIKFISPMVWRAPERHPNDCYFCKTRIPNGTRKRFKSIIEYADVPSVQKPITHYESESDSSDDQAETVEPDMDIDVEPTPMIDAPQSPPPAAAEPQPGTSSQLNSPQSVVSQLSYITPSEASSGEQFAVPMRPAPRPVVQLTQQVCNDLIRDLNLPKNKSELAASRLQDLGIGLCK